MSDVLCDEAYRRGATPEQLARIFEANQYLEHTDYTVIKVYEVAVSNPTEAEALKRQYADIFAERARYRAEIRTILDSLGELSNGGEE